MSKSFQALGVSEPVVRALARRNITHPFSVQALALPDGLAGRDLLVQSPTGSGKTLAFGIPIVERASRRPSAPRHSSSFPPVSLLSRWPPTSNRSRRPRTLRVTAVYGGTGVGPQATRARSADILIATPGRLNDLSSAASSASTASPCSSSTKPTGCSTWGSSPRSTAILGAVPRKRQTMLFSATLDGAVGGLAEAYTNDPVRVRAELPAERSTGTVEHTFVAVTPERKLDTLVEHLAAERGLALVFVRTKHGADKLAKKLARLDVPAVAMHGNLSQNARERALARFESGKVSTLVATDVAARGLDVDDVTHVINFDPPRADEDYVHRVGRTGRAGRSGTGVTFVLPEQQSDVGKLARRLGHHDAFAASGMRSTSTAPTRRRRRGR